MLGKFAHWASERLSKREIDQYLLMLRQIDSDEAGMLAALTYDWSSKLHATHGWDLFDPWALLSKETDLPMHLGRMVRSLQSQGPSGAVKASGLIVWAHTVRGAVNTKIRGEVREIWGHIRRGFPYAEDQVVTLLMEHRMHCDISNLGRFPEGFAPEVA